MSEKSILEQALLQVNTLEEAVKQNAKGILSSVMKQELNDLLKESLEEEDEEGTEKSKPSKPKKEEEQGMSEQPEDETDDNEGEGEDDSEDEDDLDNDEPSKGIDSMDSDDSMGDDMSSDDDSMSDDMSSDDDSMSDDMSSDDDSMEDDMTSDDDVMDMTGASDDEVLKVFKAMKPEDGVVVKKDGDQLDLDMGDDEYIIKLDDESGDDFEMSEENDWSNSEAHESSDLNDEAIYEIELDEEDTDEVKEIEATEAARTKSNVHGNKNDQNRAGLPSKTKYKAGSAINEEVSKLKKQNSEYKKALVLFKEKLNEVAVFNANLAYATRLFTEHSTTKQEKLNILKRFDSVSTMNESKNLYNSIKSELGTKKPVTESVVEKISNTPTTSSSTEVLSESKAYENPQFKRMKDLMAKLK